MLTEFFNLDNSSEIFGTGSGIQFTGTSVNYPVGLLDNVSGIYYHDRTNNDKYLLLNWRRTYDDWQFYCIGFITSASLSRYSTLPNNSAFYGNGFQIRAVYNH